MGRFAQFISGGILLATHLIAQTQNPVNSDLCCQYAIPSDRCDRNSIFANASFLYWQAEADGMEYIQDVAIDSNFSVSPIIQVDFNMRDLDFSWKPGVKVDLGYYFDDHWEVSLDWTYMQGRGHSSATASDPTLGSSVLKPEWFPFILGGAATKAQADWGAIYNTLDALLSKNFFLNARTSIHPFGGLRGAWIHQSYLAKYMARFYPASAPVENHETSMLGHNHFTGLGVVGGFDAKFYLNESWSFISNVATSLIYGKFKVNQTVQGYITTPTFLIKEIIYPLRNFNRVRTSIETHLGIQWEKWFNANKNFCAVSFLYDLNYWYNQNQLVNEMITHNPFVDPNSASAAFLSSDVRRIGSLQFMGISLNFLFAF